ncbi:ThuA domain-containing protein [Natronospora cellulosivora (SeqCode)]
MNNEKKILALLGDFYHPADYYTEGLQNILSKDFNLQIESDYKKVDWDNLNDYNLFILAASGKLNPEKSDEIWMTEEHERKIESFLETGASLFVLHSGLAGYNTNSLIREICKGHFLHHPEEHPNITVDILNKEHSITRDIDEFQIVDEQYFVDVDKDDINILLETKTEEYGTAAAAWVHNYKSGKVYCLTPGHTIEVLNTKMMQKLILNGVNYCMKNK